jgi:acyl carrier protein
MTIEGFKELFEADIVMVTIGTINNETVLQGLSDWDSMALISLNASLDENFGFTLTTNELLSVNTFGDIVKYIESRS